MNNKERDEICDLWIKVWGVQEGIGLNCPNGAYEFAKLVAKREQKKMIELIATAIGEAK